MKKIIIELSEEKTYQFSRERETKLPNEFPFTNIFSIKFPLKVILSKNEKVNNISEDVIMDVYINQNDQDNNLVNIKLFNSYKNLLFSFLYSTYFPNPQIKCNKIINSNIRANFLGDKLRNILSNMLFYVTNDNRDRKINEESKTYTTNNSKYKASASNKRYIYKHEYDNSSNNHKKENHKDYEQTFVRGHYRKGYWRIYKNEDGTIKDKIWIEETWVKPYIKGEELNDYIVYRITD
ncbi:hypothetical protein [Halanaerobacter jeridensis]|uniref:Uncharacterized protein n=1 Tax=Halanaerobacter jeridensis TaxID=706427 RepID=A0A938XQQ5_9FIRM|nr:hypothetical protein [Halanaerobacter jeridensis]MBM7558178.1 hypothetical protein [Halanaerobacter jeridensis]